MTNEPQPDPAACAYGRLSREDLRNKTLSMEEKIQLRKDILRTLAKHEGGIAIGEEQIHFEVESGGSLAERPALRAILDRCRRREVHTVVIADIDRLTRDIGDWKTVETAFYKGGIRLVTGRGTYVFTPQFDSTMLQILAVLGEKERRSFSFRRKATNAQRARNGQLSQGVAPYGYLWVSEQKAFVIVPAEYEIAAWVFRQALTKSTHKIAKELNERGTPGPWMGKREPASAVWLPGAIRSMLTNPLYTGRLAHRTETDREGSVVFLPRAQWIWSDHDLLTPLTNALGETVWDPLPHPVTRDEWELIQETLADRRTARKSDGPGLVNALLHCSEGRRMYASGGTYQCECYNLNINHVHRGRAVSIKVIEKYVLAAITEVIDGLTHLPSPAKKNKRAGDTVHIEAASVRRQLREKEATREDLIGRASWYHSLPGYGVEGHRKTVEALSSEIATLQTRLEALEEAAKEPDIAELLPLILQVQSLGGAAKFFDTVNPEARRLVVRMLIKKLTLDPILPDRAFTSSLQMTLHALPGRKETERSVALPHYLVGATRGKYKPRKVKGLDETI